MKATVNSDIGVKVLTEMRDENKFMPPGVEKWGFVENLAAFLDGETAMTISWPPYGRWAAGYGPTRRRWPGCRSRDRRQGRLRAAAGRPSAARRSASRCRSPRPASNKEAAYLFIQWLNSKEISLQRVQLPYALRDPFRDQPLHDRGVPVALAGRQGLPRRAAGEGARDGPARPLDHPDRQATRRRCARRLSGSGPARIRRRSSTRSPRQWDEITEQVGVDKQRAGLRGLGRQAGRLSEVSRSADGRRRAGAPPFRVTVGRRARWRRSDRRRLSGRRDSDRHFRY